MDTETLTLHDGEAIYKIDAALIGDVPTGESTQTGLDDPTLDTPAAAITPPMSLEQLSALSEEGSVRSAVIEAIARNTVGLGYSCVVREAGERVTTDHAQEAAQLRARLEALAARDTRLERPSLSELLMAVKTDEEECGNGYIEVSRDQRTGQVSGLFHVPGKRVRRLKDRTGYLLLPPDGDENKAVRYLPFGQKVAYNRDGTPQNRLAGSGGRWARNELIAFKRYTSSSRDYGLPRDASMIVEYLADSLARQTNVDFFDAGGTPATVLFVQGEERKDGGTINVTVPRQTSERIAMTLRGGRREHRVAVIPLPAGVKAQREQLGQMSDRDMGFIEFRHDMRRRTLGAFRVSPIFIADTEDAGRYTAEVERAITLEQVFDPEQSRYETRLQPLVDELGYRQLRVDFTKLAVEGDAVKRESAVSMAEAGTITRREHRAAHGYGPLPEAQEGAEPGPGEVPHGWNDEIVEIGPPRGAENRVPTGASDQRGLQPGIGARASRSPEDRGVKVAQRTAALAQQTRATGQGAVADAVARAQAMLNGAG